MKKRVLFLVAALCGVATFANAATIVQWSDQPYETDIVVGASENLVAPADYTTYVAGTAINPTVGANYYPNNAGRTPIFNGAFNEVPGTKAIIFQPGNAGNPDQIQGQGTTLGSDFSGMITFEDENFLAGAPVLQSLESRRYAFSVAGNEVSSRLLFQDNGGGWWASSAVNTFGGLNPHDIPDVTAETWVAFTPFSAGVASFGAVGAPDFTNPQAVGIYMTSVGATGTNKPGMAIGYFKATAIPEPSTIMLGLVGLGFCFRRSRDQK